MSDDHTGSARFYTGARRFPILLARWSDGSRIWGGPYRASQVGAVLAMCVLLYLTRQLWLGLPNTGKVVLPAVLIIGVFVGVGKLPLTGRRHTSVAAAIATTVFQSKSGVLATSTAGAHARTVRPTRVVAAAIGMPMPPANAGPAGGSGTTDGGADAIASDEPMTQDVPLADTTAAQRMPVVPADVPAGSGSSTSSVSRLLAAAVAGSKGEGN